MHKTLLAASLLLAPTTLSSAALAQKGHAPEQAFPLLEATGHGIANLNPDAAWDIDRPDSLSARFGLDAIPAPLVELPMLDHDFLLAQDEVVGTGPKPLRFAVPQGVELTLDMGEWIKVDGGHLWRVEIASPNAWSARLALTGLDLAEGEELTMTIPGTADSTVGPFEGTGPFANGTAWGLVLPGNVCRLEWFVPEGRAVKALPLATVDYYHSYRDIYWAASADGGEGEGGVAGNCHNQPACYSAWANESNATTRLIFGGFLCSGQMTATTAADETPYVSTANHCISTQAEANSCQFNFFYRANTCGGGTSAGTSVVGGDLVSTHFASDSTLLMIRPTIPGAATWVGWTNQNPGTGTASTGIHHPGGDPQAISFGVKFAASFPCGNPQTNWNRASWNDGVTEGGSSGSAFYRDSDKRMYGVLTCGASSCASPGSDDGYGRWDVAINSGGFASLLSAGTDDALEPNDSCAAPRLLVAGTYTNNVVKRLDEDWYVIPLPPTATMTVTMSCTHANGDVDMEVYSACGGSPVLSRLGNTNTETFSWTNNTSSSTAYLRVFLGSDTRNNYNLVLSTTAPAPANDDCANAIPVTEGFVNYTTVGAGSPDPAMVGNCNDGLLQAIYQDVWFTYTATCDGEMVIANCGAEGDTAIALYTALLGCPNSNTPVFACNDDASGCSPASLVTFPVTEGSEWIIRLGTPANSPAQAGSGILTINTVNCPPDCVADIDGDGTVGGSDLATILGAWGSADADADLDGDGTVNGADLATLLGAWGPC
jgi:hypothetical protein